MVEILLHRGAEINAPDTDNSNVLQMAPFDGHYRVVQILLDNKADANQRDLQGRTAPYFASAGGHKAIVKTLVQLAVDPCIIDMQERNCLHFAAFSVSTEMVCWFLKEGFDPDLTDRDGWTLMHWAVRGGSVNPIRVLKDAGALSSMEAINQWNPLSVAVYNRREFSVVSTIAAICGTIQSWTASIPTFSSSNLEADSNYGNQINPNVVQRVFCDGCFFVIQNSSVPITLYLILTENSRATISMSL